MIQLRKCLHSQFVPWISTRFESVFKHKVCSDRTLPGGTYLVFCHKLPRQLFRLKFDLFIVSRPKIIFISDESAYFKIVLKIDYPQIGIPKYDFCSARM